VRARWETTHAHLIAQSFLALLAACIRPRVAYIPSGEIVGVFRQRATR
jgi:hypothetical protein